MQNQFLNDNERSNVSISFDETKSSRELCLVACNSMKYLSFTFDIVFVSVFGVCYVTSLGGGGGGTESSVALGTLGSHQQSHHRTKIRDSKTNRLREQRGGYLCHITCLELEMNFH